MAIIKNNPRVVTLVILAGVAAHLVLATLLAVPSMASFLADHAEAWSLYISTASAMAVIGGFAGVLLVFAMSSTPNFARMRLRGGRSLESTWLSTVGSSLAAAGTSVAAAVIALGGSGAVAAWIFELSLLLALHAAIRLMWALSHLVRGVRQQDKADAATGNTMSYDDLKMLA